MNIIEVAKNRDEIMASYSVYCPLCGEKQFAPFDKLFVKAHERCIDCSTSEQIDTESENIFAIIEAK